VIADVRHVWREFLKAVGGDNEYDAGRMEVMLAIESRIRILREIEGTSLTALGKEETITAMEGLLQAVSGERQYIVEVYDYLDEWRRVRVEGDTPRGVKVRPDTGSSLVGAALGDTQPLHPSLVPSPPEDPKSDPSASPRGEQT
jgi:hypothetical protein